MFSTVLVSMLLAVSAVAAQEPTPTSAPAVDCSAAVSKCISPEDATGRCRDFCTRAENKQECLVTCRAAAMKTATACAENEAQIVASCEKLQSETEQLRTKAAEARESLNEALADGTVTEACKTTVCERIPAEETEIKDQCIEMCDSIDSTEDLHAAIRTVADKVQESLRQRFEAAREQGVENAEEARAALQAAVEAKRAAFEDEKAAFIEKADELKAKAKAAAEVRRASLEELRALVEAREAAETEEEKEAIQAQIDEKKAEYKEAIEQAKVALGGKREELAKKVLAAKEDGGEQLRAILIEFQNSLKDRMDEIKQKLQTIDPNAEVVADVPAEEPELRRRKRESATSLSMVGVVACDGDDELCDFQVATVAAEMANSSSDVNINEVTEEDLDAEEIQIGSMVQQSTTTTTTTVAANGQATTTTVAANGQATTTTVAVKDTTNNNENNESDDDNVDEQESVKDSNTDSSSASSLVFSTVALFFAMLNNF